MYPLAYILIASLALAGCGGPFTPKSECTGYGTGVVFGESSSLDCAMVASRLALAREILVSRGLVPADQFDAAFGGITIWVRAVDVFDGDAYGEYVPGSLDVQVNRLMQGLVHELLHRWDEHNGRPVRTETSSAGRHIGWERNGYDAASVEYHKYLTMSS